MITAMVPIRRPAWLAWAVAASLPAAAAWAGEPGLRLSLVGAEFTAEINGATRAAAVAWVLADSNATVEWGDNAFGKETVRGRYSGSPTQVVRSLLGPTSYIITYQTDDSGPRISRIVVLGSAQGSKEARSESTPKTSIRKSQPPASKSEKPKLPAWARRLEKIKADAEAVRQRAAALGSRRGLIRTQAVTRTFPSGGAGHTGNIPVVPAPKKRR